jgi:hypothetical protein
MEYEMKRIPELAGTDGANGLMVAAGAGTRYKGDTGLV